MRPRRKIYVTYEPVGKTCKPGKRIKPPPRKKLGKRGKKRSIHRLETTGDRRKGIGERKGISKRSRKGKKLNGAAR